MIIEVSLNTPMLEEMFGNVIDGLGNLEDWVDEELERAIIEGVYFARESAPVGRGSQPRGAPPHGNLAENIRYEKTDEGNYLFIADAKDIDNRGYAAYVEFGSHPGGGPTYVEPRPFMTPAMDYISNIFIINTTEKFEGLAK